MPWVLTICPASKKRCFIAVPPVLCGRRLRVVDADNGAELGVLTEVLTPPAHQVYLVKGPQGERLIPAVEEFIVETNVDGGYLRVRLIEGM